MPKDTGSDDWTDCHPGEIGQMVNRLRSRHRVHLIRQTTSAAAIVGLILVSGYFIKDVVLPSESDFKYAGVTCSEVRQLGDDYAAGKLDEKTTAQIKEHLAHCESCQEAMKKMMNGPQSQPPDAGALNGVNRQLDKGVASRREFVIPVVIALGSLLEYL